MIPLPVLRLIDDFLAAKYGIKSQTGGSIVFKRKKEDESKVTEIRSLQPGVEQSMGQATTEATQQAEPISMFVGGALNNEYDPNAVYIAGIFITNNPNLKFSDLTDEEFRVYEYLNEVGGQIGWEKVVMYGPVALAVSSSGGHRVVTSDGKSHYLPAGWKHLYWQVKTGRPAFAF